MANKNLSLSNNYTDGPSWNTHEKTNPNRVGSEEMKVRCDLCGFHVLGHASITRTVCVLISHGECEHEKPLVLKPYSRGMHTQDM